MVGSLQEKDRGYQVFPASGPLYNALNLSGRDLIQRLGEIEGSVYCYIVTSVKDRGGLFVQTGSAPNFQGGLITLCTCKWRMRTGRDLDAWPGRWIAGVTGAEAGPQGRGHLLYLMRVERAFESHRDLWLWLTEHAPEAAEARAADRHRVGDVYRPRASAGSPFDPDAYIPPHPHHVHSGVKWRKDINYIGHKSPQTGAARRRSPQQLPLERATCPRSLSCRPGTPHRQPPRAARASRGSYR